MDLFGKRPWQFQNDTLSALRQLGRRLKLILRRRDNLESAVMSNRAGLRSFVDKCDSQWIAGWADKDGESCQIEISVNGIKAAELQATFFRTDLRDAGIGDGCRGFRYWLGGHTVNGVNRVRIKVEDEIIFDKVIIVTDCHSENPRNVTSEYLLRPKFGDRVLWPSLAVAAKIDDKDPPFEARLMTWKEFDERGYTENLIAKGPFEQHKRADTYLAELVLPEDLDLPLDCALAVVSIKTGKLIDVTVITIAPPPYGKVQGKEICAEQMGAEILGPLVETRCELSDFPNSSQTWVDVHPCRSDRDILWSNLPSPSWCKAYDASHNDGAGSFLRDLCTGRELKEFQLLEQQLAWRSGGAAFVRFDDVVLFPDFGLTLFNNNMIWGDSVHPAVGRDRTFGRIPGWYNDNGHTFAAVTSHNNVRVDAAPFILFLSYNYSHWLQNSISAAWHALRQFGPDINFILPGAVSDLMLESLNILGVDKGNIITCPQSAMRLSKAIYPTCINTHSNMFPSPHNVEIPKEIARTVARLKHAAAAEMPRRIFICRKGGPVASPRTLENEAEIAEFLRTFGFAAVSLHKMSFSDQVMLFSRAEIIVGQVGAGLVNSVFAPAGCAIIELCNDTFNTNEFLWLSSLYSHRYVRIMVKSVAAWAHANFVFRVPPEIIGDVVTALEQQ